MTRKCYGCGAQLQESDPDQVGYVPQLDKSTLLCKRCYRMQHHNEYHAHALDAKHFRAVIKKKMSTKGLVILIVDLFDLNSSFDKEVMALIKKNPLIIVGTKRDLLLKSVKDAKIVQYLKKEALMHKLQVQDILLVSASKKKGIDQLLASIEKHRHQADVYMLGVTNVGKSSLVNAMINAVEKSAYQITVANYPGTTLDTIQIALDEQSSLFDLPGIVLDNQMVHYLDSSDYHYLNMKKEVKARNYQLEPQQTLYIGGLAFFNFLAGSKSNFNCFFNNDLKIHRTKYENHQTLYDEHLNDDVLVPKALNVKTHADFVMHQFKLDDSKQKFDIYISGLGWLSVVAENQVITVGVPPHVKVGIRTALI